MGTFLNYLDEMVKSQDSETGETTFTRTCSITKEPYSVKLTASEFARYNANVEHIQDIVPNMSPNEREFLISGVTPAEWNDMFSSDEEE